MKLDGQSITLLGAGLTGSLLAVMLSQRGARVTVLERMADPRGRDVSAGRSINLAMAARGMRALKMIGLEDRVVPLMCPMPGRILHRLDGSLQFLPYGTRPEDVNYSVSRRGLNELLLDAAEAAGATLRFNQRCEDYDAATHRLSITDTSGDPFRYELSVERVIASDGAGSPTRRALARQGVINTDESLLDHRYQEIVVPAMDGDYAMDPRGLHIWPRGEHMMIALPNPERDFTATLFMPETADDDHASFQWWQDNTRAQAFLQVTFPDLVPLIENLSDQIQNHPLGVMGTVRCSRWHVDDRCLLIGDAAHAIVPFHGQGMNAAFEDCVELMKSIDNASEWGDAFSSFSAQRIPDTDAIAEMALENYREMRDTVRDPGFQLRKALALHLERECPEHFITRYSMVMFHAEIPYAVAQERGRIQEAWLRAQTDGMANFDEIDLDACVRLARRTFSSPTALG
ncbi:MAG: NAD(P)/FAD-dependent oxidoreductase [Pseudomonadota bacterium]